MSVVCLSFDNVFICLFLINRIIFEKTTPIAITAVKRAPMAKRIFFKSHSTFQLNTGNLYLKSLYLNSAVLIKKFSEESPLVQSLCSVINWPQNKIRGSVHEKTKSADKHQLKDDLQSDIKAKLMEMKSQLKEEDERGRKEKSRTDQKEKEIEKTKALKNSLMKAKWIGINIINQHPYRVLVFLL